jgi:hypothetical protein
LKTFFFDTYALLAVYFGNASYQGYVDCQVVTTRLNLMEAYYQLLRDQGENIASLYYDVTLHYSMDFTDADVKDAMKFRLEIKRKGKNLSYMDAMGYSIASRLKIKFLTGDREFEGLPNVEFVK